MIINVAGDDITVPDGTTKENADRIARMHLIRVGKLKAETGPALTRQSVQEEVAARDPNLWDKFWGGGVGVRAREMAAGLQAPFKDLTPEQRNVLNTARDVRSAEGPMANIGSAAADVGVAALPLAKAAALGTKMAPGTAALLTQAPSVIPRIAATGAVGAGLGAALTPDNRGKAAAVGSTAALGPALGAANQALRARGAIPGKTLVETLKALKKIPNKLQALNTVGLGGIAGAQMGLPVGAAASAALPPAVGAFGLSEASRVFPEAMPGIIYGTSEEIMR